MPRPAPVPHGPSEPSLRPAATHRTLYLVLLTLITAAFCSWVLSLPLFPTQDGPIHLYYTAILHDLLFQAHSPYARFYTVKHILPPYSLYYYLLMLLAQAVPLVAADKIVICLYFVCFAFGIRYLATAVGPNGDVTALVATSLLINWPLAMGFVNFCLSTAFALWALGLWCRSARKPSHPRRIAFVVLAYVIMLTHPVPLLFLLGFCGVELAVRLYRDRISPEPDFSRRHFLHDILYLALACCTFIYIRIFTVSHVLAQQEHTEGTWLHNFLFQLKGYVLLHPLSIFSGHSLMDACHRFGLILILVASLAIGILQLRRRVAQHTWTLAETWTCVAIAALLAQPFIPSELNHSHFFAYRLVLYIWIAALIAASGFQLPSPLLRPAAAVFSLLLAAQILYMAQTRVTPIAREIAAIQTTPPFPSGHVGLMLLSTTHDKPSTLSYDPYRWAGTHFFRRTGSVLYDSPWLDLAIIAIGPQPIMPTSLLGPEALEDYTKLRPLFAASPATRDLVLRNVDFALISNGAVAPSHFLDPILAADPDTLHPWACTSYGWYSLCQRSGQRQ